jgi:hypothetical protein
MRTLACGSSRMLAMCRTAPTSKMCALVVRSADRRPARAVGPDAVSAACCQWYGGRRGRLFLTRPGE